MKFILSVNQCMQHYKKEHFLIDNGQSGSRIVLGMPAMLKSCQMVRVMATPLWGRDMASIRNRIRSSPIFIAFVESSHAQWGKNIYETFSCYCGRLWQAVYLTLGSKFNWPLGTRVNKSHMVSIRNCIRSRSSLPSATNFFVFGC